MRKFIEKFKINHFCEFIVFLVGLFLVFYYFYGIIHYRYPVPPGDDTIRHITEAKTILLTGQVRPHTGSLDPPLFHILIASLAAMTNLHVVTITKILTPSLVILATLSIYVLTKRWFKNSILACIALILYAFFSPQPEQIYDDGTYLNLIASEYFFLYLLLFLPSLIQSDHSSHERLKYLPVVLIFSAAVLYSHGLSSIYLLLFLFILAMYLLFLRWREKIFFSKPILFYFVGIFLLIPITWKFYLGSTIEKVLSAVGLLKLDTQNILNTDFTEAISPIPTRETYDWLLNPFLISLALFGLFSLFQRFKNHKEVTVVLTIWTGVLFWGSRTAFFQLPERFARDLTVPVILLVSLFLFDFLMRLERCKAILIGFLLLLILGSNIRGKIERAFRYNPMIRVQYSDLRAFHWISKNTSPEDTILAVPRTIVAGDWGSFLELLTNRKTIDGSVCPPNDDGVCDPIYDAKSPLAMDYYSKESIDYVYAGKMILGSFLWKDRIDWSYTRKLSRVSFLKKVAEFPENKNLGGVTIFRVDLKKLEEERQKIQK